MQTAVQALVIVEQHASSLDTVLDNSQGVSIFFPIQSSSYYDGNNNDFAAGTQWGGVVPLAAAQVSDTVGWGPLLASFVQAAYPDAPDISSPAAPAPRLLNTWQVLLPLVRR